jgi:hypothetical protein
MSYKEAREAFGLSREKLSGLAKRAGIRVSAASIKKLEEDEKAAGSRGLGDDVVGYLNYVLGIGEFEATDWSTVEKGAPVVVAGEKGVFSFISTDGSTITVFSDKFRYFEANRVRLVAPTALPSEGDAALYETRTRGDGGVYAQEVLAYINQHPDMPHAVGALAYALGRDNGLISRTVASLVKAGKLTKAGRGVVTLPSGSSPAPAPVEAPAAAEIPSF